MNNWLFLYVFMNYKGGPNSVSKITSVSGAKNARSLVRMSRTKNAGSAMASLPLPRDGEEGLQRNHSKAGGQDGTRSDETVFGSTSAVT